MNTRSRKARFGIIGAGLLAAAITVGIAAPSQAAEITNTNTSTSVSQEVDGWVGNKSVEMNITNHTGSSATIDYLSTKGDKRGHDTIGIGSTFHFTRTTAICPDWESKLTLKDGTVIYIAAKNPNIGKPWIGIGSSEDDITEIKVSDGDKVHATVNGHEINVDYSDGDYKTFNVEVR